MANEASAPPAGPGQNFRLDPAQMLAMHLIETAQNSIAFAADRCAGPIINQPDAAKLLIEALRVLDSAKLQWLQATQRKVTLAPVGGIPPVASIIEGIKANGGHIGG